MTATTDVGQEGSSIGHLPVRRVRLDAPWDWMAKGWNDLLRAPTKSLAYGGVFTLIAWLLVWGLTQVEMQSLILVLAGGFILLGPLFAGGLYALSRAYERKEDLSLREAIVAGTRPKGQLSFFALALMLAFMFWVQIAFLLLMLFFGGSTVVNFGRFLPELLFTSSGQGLLTVGTLVGAVLATIVFSVSAVAAPLLFDRDISALSAMATSVRAVLLNKGAMLLWAAILAGTMILGLATMFAGLIVAFPLAGHATWHAMRALVDTGRS